MIFSTDALGLYSLDIKYEGTTKATQPCIDAFLKILYGSQTITGMTILTCGEHHAIMLEYTNKENITFIKSGLTSGYNGEGPRGTSTIIKLAEEARITIKELAISRRLMKKVNESLVTAKDVHSIQESSKENFDYKRLSLKIVNEDYLKRVKNSFKANKDIIFIRNEKEKETNTVEIDKAAILKILQKIDTNLNQISTKKDSTLSNAGSIASIASMLKDLAF